MTEINLFSKRQIAVYRTFLWILIAFSVAFFVAFINCNMLENDRISKIFACLFLIFIGLFFMLTGINLFMKVIQKNKIVQNMDKYILNRKYNEALDYLNTFNKTKIFNANYQIILFYYAFVHLQLDDIEKSKKYFDKTIFENINYVNAQFAASYYFLYFVVLVSENDSCDKLISNYNDQKNKIVSFIRNKEEVKKMFEIIDIFDLNNVIDKVKLNSCFYSEIPMIKRICETN